jgi:hypothetical protein
MNKKHVARVMKEFYDYKSFISDHVKPLHALRQAHIIRVFKVFENDQYIRNFEKLTVTLFFTGLGQRVCLAKYQAIFKKSVGPKPCIDFGTPRPIREVPFAPRTNLGSRNWFKERERFGG